MARIDLLMNKPSKAAPIRVGDIRGDAPHMNMTVDGQTAVLPMPTNVSSAGQILWEQKDFTPGASGMGAAILGTGIDAGNLSLRDVAKAGAGGIKQSGNAFKTGVAGVVGSAAGIENAPDYYNHKNNRAVNPNKEVTFNGLGYRSFNFEFQFIPLSSDESNRVQAFIQFFQEHATPDFSNGDKTYFAYPGAWRLLFSENVSNYMPLFLPCYLTDYSINYGAVGKQVHHEDGAPVQIDITLTFTESELLMKSKIQQGIFG